MLLTASGCMTPTVLPCIFSLHSSETIPLISETVSSKSVEHIHDAYCPGTVEASTTQAGSDRRLEYHSQYIGCDFTEDCCTMAKDANGDDSLISNGIGRTCWQGCKDRNLIEIEGILRRETQTMRYKIRDGGTILTSCKSHDTESGLNVGLDVIVMRRTGGGSSFAGNVN